MGRDNGSVGVAIVKSEIAFDKVQLLPLSLVSPSPSSSSSTSFASFLNEKRKQLRKVSPLEFLRGEISSKESVVESIQEEKRSGEEFNNSGEIGRICRGCVPGDVSRDRGEQSLLYRPFKRDEGARRDEEKESWPAC